MIWTTILMAFREIRRNPMRSALTMLGIVIGVASVIIMVALGRGAATKITADIAGMGTNLIIATPGSERKGPTASVAQPFRLEDARAVERELGGIGIMNIMLVSVTERTREIGIRLSIGARGREVLFQFLVEAVALSGIGGAAGILLGLVVSYIAARLLHLPFSFVPDMVVVSFLFSASVGVVFGYLPARKASRLNPIEALRHE